MLGSRTVKSPNEGGFEGGQHEGLTPGGHVRHGLGVDTEGAE